MKKIPKVETIAAASKLSSGWESQILADMPAARVKLFKVDPNGLPDEMHDDYPEALFVIEGSLELIIGEDIISMRTGDFQLIPQGVMHSIRPGGRGTILLIDPE